jgi:glycerol uptake facilitator-like aquaporin
MCVVGAASFDAGLVTLGDGGEKFPNAQMVFISLGVAAGFALGIFVAPHSELNPVFTLAIAIGGKKKWSEVPLHFFGQLTGNVVASLLFWQVSGRLQPFNTALSGFIKFTDYAALLGCVIPPGKDEIPSTMPWLTENPYYLTNGQCFFNTVLFTSLMVVIVVSAILANPDDAHPAVKPLIIGLIIFVFVGAQTPFGVVLNPAMWFAGMIVACWTAPYSMAHGDVPKYTAADLGGAHDHFYWVALFAPFVGSIVGMILLVAYSKLVYVTKPKYS